MKPDWKGEEVNLGKTSLPDIKKKIKQFVLISKIIFLPISKKIHFQNHKYVSLGFHKYN